ncbi:MAG: hypothetical protein QXZ62_08985 [Candidatus Caldarchaeum sp.]
MYKPLFHFEANDGREVRIAVWVEDGIPCFSYKEDEESPFVPSGHQPNYDKGESYCSKCCQTFINRDKCPNCNRILRKNQEERNTNQPSSYTFWLGFSCLGSD